MTSFRISSPFSGAAPASVELATWPRGALASHDDPDLRISLDRFAGPVGYPLRPGFERYLLPLAGTDVELTDADDRRLARPRPGEVTRISGEQATRVAPRAGKETASLVVATVRRGAARPSLQLFPLGRRELREPLGPLAAILVLGGSLRVRATNEEEALDLEDRECLCIEDGRAGDELALAGLDEGTRVVLVQLDA